MRTVRTKIYKFKELSPEAKKKVIENSYDINTRYEWWDFEDAKTIGNIFGIDIDEIYFSGFSSQGDGACFVGSYGYAADCESKIKEYAPKDKTLHRIGKELADIQKEHNFSLTATVTHRDRHYHAYSTDIEVLKDGDYTGGEVERQLSEILRDFMNWIYKTLEAENDYLTSEEAIIETIEANDYEFTKDGKIYHS